MAELSGKKREGLKDSDFAYVDQKGERHLPINDDSHIRNAMARWNQTDFDSKSAKEAALALEPIAGSYATVLFALGLLIQGAFTDLLSRLFAGGLGYLVCLGFAVGLLMPDTGLSALRRLRRTFRVKGELS